MKLFKNRMFVLSLQNRPKELEYLKDGRDKQSDSRISKNKHLGLLTKQALNENNVTMDQTSVSSSRWTKRASSESSLLRIKRRENNTLTTPGNYFPSVENAVKHFRRKMDGPRVVSVSIPLNKRQSFSDGCDEHRLKYHHRSSDELEKMSQNSERLRTVIDEEIDLDYIDIVYEANKPSKQRYISLSCAPPLMPKYFSRQIKLQQRIDSRETSAKEGHERTQDTNNNVPDHTSSNDEFINTATDAETTDGKYYRPINNKISVHIEYRTDNSVKQHDNSNIPDKHASPKVSTRTRGNIDPFKSPHRYSYYCKSNGFIGGVNRANTRDMRKVFRYSKHINQNYRAKN